jgi:RNA polymerase sigma factor (sigma-70 family)
LTSDPLHPGGEIEGLLRSLAPVVLAALVRRHVDFDACEDAVQEALLAAATQWPADGIPANPRGWLMTVASRRLIELWRNESARRRREETTLTLDARHSAEDPATVFDAPTADDSLALFVLCCHPALTPTSQIALTLRAVGGLTTAEIARALLVPEATVGQRISRAKERIRESGGGFAPPSPEDRDTRIAAVLQVLYLIFNEGYTASSGGSLTRVELSMEAIRLARQLHEVLPADGEVAGLLALMLLTDARRPARTTADGSLIPLAEQDRTLWDRRVIAEGVALVTDALARRPVGPYQLQAAIAAVHDEALRAEDTDWREILGLYELLDQLAPGPMVTLNRIVAHAMVDGPRAALTRLAEVAEEAPLAGHHRVHAVRAHLLEMAGETGLAREAYLLAARRTLSLPERRFLESRARRLTIA